MVILNGSSDTALGVNVCSLKYRIQLMEGRKISQQTLAEHILLEHFQRLVASPLVRGCVPDCHVTGAPNDNFREISVRKTI